MNIKQQEPMEFEALNQKREPIFNVPAVILILIGVQIAIEIIRAYVLSDEGNLRVLFDFAFIPARYSEPEVALLSPYAGYWTPMTYSLLHGGWTHLLMNCFWLLAFGAVVARRIGPIRFICLFILGAIGGALVHYLAHAGELVPMIGASASVSACMGAAVRFAFPKGGSFARDASHLPLQSLAEGFQNRQVIIFIAVWFGINLIVGAGLISIDGSGSSVAWEAHIGGFLVGLLLFTLFEKPIKR